MPTPDQPFRICVFTIHPDMFPGPLAHGVTGRALGTGKWCLEVYDLRRFGLGVHRAVDDTPAGGGAGMVMRVDVIARALDECAPGPPEKMPRLAMSARGTLFNQRRARRLAARDGLVLVCGRFEGIDERVFAARDVEEVSIGDYVLAGGECAAMALAEAVIRLRPGVLGNAASSGHESHEDGLLEYPQYTRPAEFEGHRIPDILLSGNHAKIAQWRARQSQQLTAARRPDLPYRITGRPGSKA